MPEQDSSAMPVQGDRAVTTDDVTAAYAVYLGRRPDEPERNAEWLGLTLSKLLAAFVSSPEFVAIHKDIVKAGGLINRTILSGSELAAADRWLSQVTSEHRPSPGVQWPDLLLAAVTSPILVALAEPGIDDEALAILKRDVEARHEGQGSLSALVSFDPAVFLASPSHRRYQHAKGGVDFQSSLPEAERPPVLLPAFTEGLAAVRKPGQLVLGDWLEQTQNAALAGSLTHWLWDEATYLKNAAAAGRDLTPAMPSGAAFLDFLAIGDVARVSPHPLFCHFTYDMLNHHDPAIDRPAFQHFINAQEANGPRTSALFDPDFYLARNPQVREAIAAGKYGSALEHFVKLGMAGGYAFSPDFDRDFYLALYPDVSATIADSILPSAEWHYVFYGAREGRAPNPYFDPRYYASRYPLMREEMLRLGIATTMEHFLLLGRDRDWRVNQPLAERPVAMQDGKALFEKRGRRALGEIMDGAVAIPNAEAPRLSVIVPVSNQADLTAGFLKCAAFAIETLKSRRGCETEIIVIDNGSRDHTGSLLAALPAVRVERFESAIGFPLAVNAGARTALGDILLVVNNDIEFQPDAFDRVVSVLDDHPSVGVIGAKIILPNETLQEVGSMLDRLGSSHGLGRGADPAEVRGIRRVEVDYVSGCFAAFRRADFESLSGFDETFSPGYFEDVDFSLRMKRDLGKTTIVDTGLAVTHYENASFAKGRPPSVNTALILRNRLRLKTAHAPLFQNLDPGRPRRRAKRARDAMTGPARLLVLMDRLPGSDAFSKRQEMILTAFAELDIPFDMVALNSSLLTDRHENPRVRIFRAWMPGQSVGEVLRDHAGDYSHLWIWGGASLTCHAVPVARAKAEFDLTVICDTDVLSSRQAVERMRLAGGPIDDELASLMLEDELAEPLDVDLWVTADAHDRTMLERVGLGPTVAIGPMPRFGDDVAAELAAALTQSDINDRIRTVLANEIPVAVIDG